MTPSQMTAHAAKVRRALVQAGATSDQVSRVLADWLRRLDAADGVTCEQRFAAIVSVAAGFGFRIKLLSDGRVLLTSETVHGSCARKINLAP